MILSDKFFSNPFESTDNSKRWLNRRQYKIVGSDVIQLENLRFEFQSGRCLNYDDENVILVGDFEEDWVSWNFDGQRYSRLPTETTFQHHAGGLARYNHNGKII